MSDEAIRHLERLWLALAAAGLRSQVVTGGACPRLRVHGPFGDLPADEFDNNVLAVEQAGRWYFAWPWHDLIAGADELDRAVAAVVDEIAGIDLLPPARAGPAAGRAAGAAHCGQNGPDAA